MALKADYVDFVNDQMSEFGPYEAKKMFGGIGFFKEGTMFGMIGKGTLRFRVDATNKGDYEAKGMKPLTSENKKRSMPYYEVPVDVLEDKTELKKWADKAYSVAVANKK